MQFGLKRISGVVLDLVIDYTIQEKTYQIQKSRRDTALIINQFISKYLGYSALSVCKHLLLCTWIPIIAHLEP